MASPDEPCEAETVTVESETEDKVLHDERERTCRQLSSAVREAIGRLPENDRLLLHLRFSCRLTGPQIARSMHIEQKLLYRRIDKLMHDLRAELERAGIAPRDAADLIGREGTQLDFALGNPVLRPSPNGEGPVAAQGEVSR